MNYFDEIVIDSAIRILIFTRMFDERVTRIYSDGSCHTQLLTGTWAAIIFCGDNKFIIKGLEEDTTHNRMEVFAVIKALEYLEEKNYGNLKIEIYSDSQYVVNLRQRADKLLAKNFVTKAGKKNQNADLMVRFFGCLENKKIDFIKVKAHQKDGDVFNREVDTLVRQLLREAIR
jgi:ribonuclease HI